MREWKTVIRSQRGLFDLPLKELWQYRSLIFMLVSRNYKLQYKQTILGPLWIFFNVILSSGLFSLVFGYVGKFSSDGLPYFLFYMSASIIWGFFSACLGSNSGVFMANAYLFGKVYFPRLIVPIANVVFELVKMLSQLIVFGGVWLFFFLRGEVIFTGVYLCLFPFLVLVMAMLGMSLGLLISSATTKYRDLTHCVGFGLQLLMYASPVIYPMSQLPDFLKTIVLLNPVASVIEAFRFILTGSGQIRWGALCYSAVVTFVLTVISLIVFNQTEKNFIDIV